MNDLEAQRAMIYQSKLVQKLSELYEQYDPELRQAQPPFNFLYRALSHDIPRYLQTLDEKPDLQGKIIKFVVDFAEAVKESDIKSSCAK